MEVTEFTANLYYRSLPTLTLDALVQAWRNEGYTCELSDNYDPQSEVFRGFRGGTFLSVTQPQVRDTEDIPEHYPEATCVNVDYAKTFLIDPRLAFEDFQASRYEVELMFRIVKEPANPRTAHNELATVLLGIFQTFPIDAAWLHQLGILVGHDDLEEFTSYTNTHLEAEPQFAPQLAFGTFITQHGRTVKAWTSGLEHFDHRNVFVETDGIDPLDAISLVFNVGYSVTGARRFNAGETIAIPGRDLFCLIETDSLFGTDALRFTPVEAAP